MPAGVTQFSSKVKPIYNGADGGRTDGRWTSKSYTPLMLAQTLTQSTSVGLTTLDTQVGAGGSLATGDGSSTSNIGGIALASAGTCDFLCDIPDNFDAAATSYLDVYYFLTGAGTKGDRVGFTGSYRATSVNSTAANLIIATNDSGVTNPSVRVLATSKALHFMYKDSITFAPSLFTANTLPIMRITAVGGFTKPEMRVARIVHRYARSYM